MKPIRVFTTVFSLVLFLGSCVAEKKNDQILKHSIPDTLNKQSSYGTIKNLGRLKKVDRDGLLFDQYIANDFRLPKKKKDSAAVVNYFVETSFAQLGRREFRQWDIVVIRGVVFQVNVEKKLEPERPLFPNQFKIELMGMIFLLLGYYFF
ncbi:hypothetical protein WG904_12680 [Pedobacter sp. Du54]|uniref:hypothetical protein n=1 Tax=Pedobacter anseongensis TaxID=3133439 RepID=UPI00309E154D